MYGELRPERAVADEDHARDFLNRHQDKLLFGSDCTDHDGSGDQCYCTRQQATVRRLAPGPQAVRKMLYGNAARVLKIA
jgi:predicted TIM-barrel fold metal-dependent hydrolase